MCQTSPPTLDDLGPCRDVQGRLTHVNGSWVERGDRILPPVETPLGKVASAICFDVSIPKLNDNAELVVLTARPIEDAVSRDQPRPKAHG